LSGGHATTGPQAKLFTYSHNAEFFSLLLNAGYYGARRDSEKRKGAGDSPQETPTHS